MDIKIKAKFSMGAVEKHIQKAIEQQNNAIQSFLENAGEVFIETAHANADFMNHTYNLRSSIGYGVVKDGKVVKSEFKALSTGEEGVRKGKSVLDQAVSELNLNKGFALIGVAGEDYAAAVEAKGKDVITSTSMLIEDMLNQALKK